MSPQSTQPDRLHEAYTGARATPALVGRASILAQIAEEIQQQGATTILYFVGHGGVGKTRLIQHILATYAEQEDLMVADRLIDLYHTRNRSIGGLAESILEVIKPVREYMHSRPQGVAVDKKLEALARAEQEGLSTAELVSRQEELTDPLLAVINQFTQTRRLVLALDTAERLFVARDVAQEKLGLTDQRPIVLDWLLNKFLAKIQNAVILIAGRPEPLNLSEDLRKVAQGPQQLFLPLPLAGLLEEEALTYFEIIREQAAASERPADRQAALMIQQWTLAERQAIFYCLRDDGPAPHIRPILLALAIDHLVVAGRPLPELTCSLAEAMALTDQERRIIEEALGRALIQSLHQYRHPANEIILALGWLRKGADVHLLCKVSSELNEAEVATALAQIRDLSFVKIRPADERIFLHDEIYDLINRFALEQKPPDEPERIYTAIQHHYDELIAAARTAIDELYRPQADTYEETLPDPLQVRLARARLQDAMSESLYYKLRQNAVEAYQYYFLATEEALANNDEILNALLRAELFSFLAERDPKGEQEIIDGLQRAQVVADSAVRWVVWLWSREHFREALALAERLATTMDDLIKPAGVVAEAYLLVWFGFVATYVGNYKLAESRLPDAIHKLTEWGRTQKRTPRWGAILAHAYNSLGYLYARQTRLHEAIDAYKRAIQLWQSVKLRVQEATTLNNIAFARSKIGVFDAAFEDAKAGLRLREQLGPRAPVGLSMNTLALIELSNNELTAARRDADRALQIFERMGSARGRGLALIALSEATRRVSQLLTYLQQGTSAQMLAEAVGYATQAEAIFSTEINEPARRVEALREQGRAYRTWARLRRERPTLISAQESKSGKYALTDLIAFSKQAFAQAHQLAPVNSLAQIELILEEAFLHFYFSLYRGAPAFPKAQQEFDEHYWGAIKKAVPLAYQQIISTGQPPSRSWYWVQIGIMEVLSGHIAFSACSIQQHNQVTLTDVLEHYFRGLTFHRYFSDFVFQELRLAADQIYENLRELDLAQKHTVYQIVTELEEKYQLPQGHSQLSKFLEDRFGAIDVFELAF
jgi:tetratricopeptide (TPR) repeat protein